MTDFNAYTVGWICATQVELVAAQELLDEEETDTIETPTNDNNSYTLGKIGKHCVVIAALPMGQYGTTSSANAARDMMRTFPNLRIGFMVGIGGGVPSQHDDIRLGDIVVGCPDSRSGGLIQYDYGKAIQGQGIDIMGALNQPPISILTAVHTLSALHKRKGHTLQETVQKVLENNPRLMAEYRRPHDDTDRLYKAEFVHPSGPSGAKGCSIMCSESNLIPRQPRTKYQDNPKIHYGIIASGNQLMEDAVARDNLSSKEKVLCFEMEAAGLANHFPCVAIRGICDYSDSHRGHEWQGYAAIIAAAYARELLLGVSPQKVNEAKTIEQVVTEGIDTVRGPILDTNDKVGYLALNQERENELKILDWLGAIDYSSDQKTFWKQHQRGTGQLFKDSDNFQTWLETKNAILFCSGMPGAGKTITTAITVEYLESRFSSDPTVGVAYVYCNYQRRDKQKPQDLLSSLLKQLAKPLPSFPDDLRFLYQRKGNGREDPLLQDIVETLHAVVNLHATTFIIIDALDELESAEDFLSEIWTLREHTSANIFITSRPSQSLNDKPQGCLVQDIQAENHDVRLYIDQRMTEMKALSKENKEIPEEKKMKLRELIKERISEVVEGIFLLARFHLETVINKTTCSKIEAALQDLPTGPKAYKHAYEKTIQRIANQEDDHRDLARRTLAWLTLARGRLTKDQLRHALSVRDGISGLRDGDLESTILIVHVCMGLVRIEEDSDTNIVSLLHFTTMEFLQANPDCLLSLETLDDRKIIVTPSMSDSERRAVARKYYQGKITASCATYLRFADFGRGQCEVTPGFFPNPGSIHENESMLQIRIRRHPLYSYAAKNWGYHACEAESPRRILDFLKSEPHTSASSQFVPAFRSGTDNDRLLYGGSVRLGRVTGLHLAAYFGLDIEVADLLRSDMEPDVRDGWGRTPLSYACEEGHIGVVEQLLDHPVDPESLSDDELGSPRTPLSHAARRGHAEVVTMLLEKGGVNPEPTPPVNQGECERSPLSFASEAGHEVVVKILLATKGVNPDSQDPAHRTPLSYAAGSGHRSIARLLLRRKEVDPDSKAGKLFADRIRTPLSYAAEGGHKTLVQLLLATGRVRQDSRDRFDRTPLSFAAGAGHEAVAGLLLATKKVDPDSKDSQNKTPLAHAAEAGHEDVVKRLLAFNDVNNDSGDNEGRASLHDVPRPDLDPGQPSSLDDMIMILLANGRVDPNSKDNKGWTPLFYAAANGHEATVKILLERKDVNVKVQDNSGQTVLYHVMGRFDAIFELLLAHKKMEPDSKDQKGRTPLSYTAESWGTNRLQMLLANSKVNPDTMDTSGRTPLSYAAERGNFMAVEILLAKEQVNPDARDALGQTPLSYAAGRGNLRVFELLITSNRVEADSEDNSGRSPLSYLAGKAQEILNELNAKDSHKYHGPSARWERQSDEEKVERIRTVIRKFLAERGVDPFSRDSQGRMLVDVMPEIRYYGRNFFHPGI